MLRSILSFLKKEPRYFAGLLLLLAFYGFFLLKPQAPPVESKLSAGVSDFRDAEKKWNREMGQEGAFDEFAKRQPVLAILFEIMTIFFILALMTGAVIDLGWLRKRFFKKKAGMDPILPGMPSWPFSMLFKVVVLFMVWGIILSFLMGMAHAVFPKGASNNHYIILHTVILNMIGLFFMVKFVRMSGGRWQDLGFHVPSAGFFREVIAGFIGYLGILPVFVLVVAGLLGVAGIFHYEPPAHPLVNVFLEEEKRAPLLIAASILLGTVVGPIFEEIFFRGFCYPILRGRWGKFWGMGLSAAFFAGIHHSGFVFWPVFILGIALAYLYEKRRSLIASITLHITHNTLFIGYFFLIKQILGR